MGDQQMHHSRAGQGCMEHFPTTKTSGKYSRQIMQGNKDPTDQIKMPQLQHKFGRDGEGQLYFFTYLALASGKSESDQLSRGK